MNAVNTTITEILCRIDHNGNPVVFLANTLNNGQIKAWLDGSDKAGIKKVGVDYYNKAEPLSEADAKELANRYSQATGEDVYIRQRLPRTYKTIPNRLTNNTGKQNKGKSDARSIAAKRRVVAEQAAADAVNDAAIGGVKTDDAKLQELATKIAKILLDAGM